MQSRRSDCFGKLSAPAYLLDLAEIALAVSALWPRGPRRSSISSRSTDRCRTSILDQEDTARAESAVTSPLEHLEVALSCDPKNWIARFSLALELCKSGYPHEAVEQFEVLQKLFGKVLAAHGNAAKSGHGTRGARDLVIREDSKAFAAVYKHLGKYPACPYLVRYNKAIALAAYDEPFAREEALRILDELAELSPAPAENFWARFRTRTNVALKRKGCWSCA